MQHNNSLPQYNNSPSQYNNSPSQYNNSPSQYNNSHNNSRLRMLEAEVVVPRAVVVMLAEASSHNLGVILEVLAAPCHIRKVVAILGRW